MGNSSSKGGEDQGNAVTGRAVGITGGGALRRATAPKLPSNAVKVNPEDYKFIEVQLRPRHAGRRTLHKCCMLEQASTV